MMPWEYLLWVVLIADLINILEDKYGYTRNTSDDTK